MLLLLSFTVGGASRHKYICFEDDQTAPPCGECVCQRVTDMFHEIVLHLEIKSKLPEKEMRNNNKG